MIQWSDDSMTQCQADIVLTTLNARYAHASFGLRYLMANLGDLRERAAMLEFDVTARSVDVVEAILAREPRVVGVGVYIWNAEQSLRLVADLKRVRPGLIVIVGGPEVSYETEQQEICRLADFVVTSEADLAFAELCEQLLNNRRPLTKVIAAPLPQFAPEETKRRRDEETKWERGRAHSVSPSLRDFVSLPYDLYTDDDLAHRVVYVEASRGCPFKCEFCLSSLDVPVRNVPIDAFLTAMQSLLDRGCRRFKFVDRTFNLNLNVSGAILRFFLERVTPELFLHFEMIPDRLPEPLRDLIVQFPPGCLQFEVGIQTFDEEVAARISRRQDNAKVEQNLRWLRGHTGVHVHADLIVGLPGESIESFGRGFDRLYALRPQEIQIGMLKRLRGTPIVRHDAAFGMVCSPHPPYEVLQTGAIDFATMQRMRRFSRYWDLIANSGNFVETTELLCTGAACADVGSASADRLFPSGAEETEVTGPLKRTLPKAGVESGFHRFLTLSDWLYAKTNQTHAIALQHLAELLFEFLTHQLHVAPQLAAETIWRDYQRGGRSDRPAFLRPYVGPADTRAIADVRGGAPTRQARHLTASSSRGAKS
jgi:radical SAM superfamily enzyme YgiQ (UPF0313 family)